MKSEHSEILLLAVVAIVSITAMILLLLQNHPLQSSQETFTGQAFIATAANVKNTCEPTFLRCSQKKKIMQPMISQATGECIVDTKKQPITQSCPKGYSCPDGETGCIQI